MFKHWLIIKLQQLLATELIFPHLLYKQPQQISLYLCFVSCLKLLKMCIGLSLIQLPFNYFLKCIFYSFLSCQVSYIFSCQVQVSKKKTDLIVSNCKCILEIYLNYWKYTALILCLFFCSRSSGLA